MEAESRHERREDFARLQASNALARRWHTNYFFRLEITMAWASPCAPAAASQERERFQPNAGITLHSRLVLQRFSIFI